MRTFDKTIQRGRSDVPASKTAFRVSARRLLIGGALSALSLSAATNVVAADYSQHGSRTPLGLVEIVRNTTQRYLDINAAVADGYTQFLGCVSSPQQGAMGVHYVNGANVADGLLDATQPEALIYEFSGNQAKLVGVEFIVDAATWMASHTEPPVLEGQSFQYVGSPNRYGLPALFELHVWAWRNNPNGRFADYNTRVTCDRDQSPN